MKKFSYLFFFFALSIFGFCNVSASEVSSVINFDNGSILPNNNYLTYNTRYSGYYTPVSTANSFISNGVYSPNGSSLNYGLPYNFTSGSLSTFDIRFKFQVTGNYYQKVFSLYPNNDPSLLASSIGVSNGKFLNVTNSPTISNNVWYNLEVQVIDNVVSYFLNGTEFFSQSLSSNVTGFVLSRYQDSVNYDDVEFYNYIPSNYELKLDKDIREISDFYINAINPDSIQQDYYEFKFSYNPATVNNPIYPDWNVQFFSEQYGSDHFVLDSGSSGLTYSCSFDGYMQNCEGVIALRSISSSFDGSYAYRWVFSFNNYDDLNREANIKFYDLSLNNFGVSYTQSIFSGMTRYVLNGSDILVSPNGSYDIYLKNVLDYNNLDAWVYDSSNFYFKNKLTCNLITNGRYCYYHFNGTDSDYLRLLLYSNPIVIYSDSDLHFNSVSSDNKVTISTNDGDVVIDVSSSNDVRVDSNSPSFLNFFTSAFNFFKKIFIFIFDMITNFYNSMPLALKYYVALSFILLVIFIMRNFV